MMRTNILQYLEETAERLPEKLAFSDGTEGMSFGALLDQTRRIGSALLSRGVQREAVLVLMERHPAALGAFFGVISAGCFYVPLDASMPIGRMEKICESTNALKVIADRKNFATAEKLMSGNRGEAFLYDELIACESDPDALAAVRSEQIDTDPVYVVFTSGSTGVPKGVVACHRSVIDYGEALCEALPFGEDAVFGNQTPLFFDAPLKEILPTLKYGATTYLIPKRLFLSPVRLVEYLNQYRINTICWVVSALTMISSLGTFKSVRPEYLRTVCFGSEVFPRKQYDLWRETLPAVRFFNLYGPTEATGMSCFWECNRALAPEEPIPVGRPFRNTAILLLTEENTAVSVNETGRVGEICMRGTCVTLGYYNNPEKTEEAFVQNPLNRAYPEMIYRTGDLGSYNAYGELVFHSRKDDQIKHMGHRIELGEIEAAAGNCRGVRMVCCVYDSTAKRIRLYYTGESEPEAVLKCLREELPRYMLPALVRKLETMPQTPNGKLDRKALRERTEE